MAKLMLHKPRGKNPYCGPTAMSAITGFTSDECAAVARMVGGRRFIKGMYNNELIKALNMMGVTLVPFAVPQKTAREAIDALPDEVRQRIVVMSAGHHYQTFLRETMVCSLSDHELVHINSMPKPRAKVSKLWLVEFRTAPVLPKMASTRVRNMEKARQSKQRRETRALAARLGLSIEKDWDCILVKLAKPELYAEIFAKHGLDADGDIEEVFYDHVFGGHSMAHDWAEVAEIVSSVALEVKRLTGIVVE